MKVGLQTFLLSNPLSHATFKPLRRASASKWSVYFVGIILFQQSVVILFPLWILRNSDRNMLQNEHYEGDIMYITQLTRNVLSLLGVWPSFKRRSIGEKAWKFLLI